MSREASAITGRVLVGWMLHAALGHDPVQKAENYATAFVAGMLYNLGAVALICLLLLMLVKTTQTKP